jgi:hypothetical protein
MYVFKYIFLFMSYKNKTVFLLLCCIPLETNHIAMFQGPGTRNYVLCLTWLHGVHIMHFDYYSGLQINTSFTLTYIHDLGIWHEFTIWRRIDNL